MQLHGGFATCAHRRSDFFGKLSASFSNALVAPPQPPRRAQLRPWLDPHASGALRCAGAEAAPPGAAAPPLPRAALHLEAPGQPGFASGDEIEVSRGEIALVAGSWFAQPLRLTLSRAPAARVTVRLRLRGAGRGAVWLSEARLSFEPETWWRPASTLLRGGACGEGGVGEGGDGSGGDGGGGDGGGDGGGGDGGGGDGGGGDGECGVQ